MSQNPQGMKRTARTDDGDTPTRADACREHDYATTPDHGFAFPPDRGLATYAGVDFAALFATDGEELPSEGR